MVQMNPFLVVPIEDFNTEASNWFCLDKISFEGDAIENLTSLFGLHQIVKEPTHILDTSSLCKCFIFTSQPDLIIESRVHSSPHANCHHHIIYAKLHLEIIYSPPYVWEVMSILDEQLMNSVGKWSL